MRASVTCTFLCASLLALSAGQTRAAPNADAPAAAAASPGQAPEVYTRAIVRSVFEEDSGRRQYIRLKLAPRAKLPFTTVTYRVVDRRLTAGLREGQSVAFRAERRDGENVLTAIRVVPPCVRFQKCE